MKAKQQSREKIHLEDMGDSHNQWRGSTKNGTGESSAKLPRGSSFRKLDACLRYLIYSNCQELTSSTTHS
jgi:hypothetical protein